jgi:ornithine cyclodeaminase
LRTAAASAVSIKHLARPDAKVLGMVGAGHQSAFQMRAAVEQRAFEKVVGWNFHPEMLDRLAGVAAELGLPFEAVSLDELGAQSDVIITITSSHKPILRSAQVKAGTHIACMGTDTKGKQEVDDLLVARATVFTDEVAQAISIGECQHAIASGLMAEAEIAELGAVINGSHKGRTSAEEVTLFDGTGVGLQDLAVAVAVVELAIAKGIAIEVDF